MGIILGGKVDGAAKLGLAKVLLAKEGNVAVGVHKTVRWVDVDLRRWLCSKGHIEERQRRIAWRCKRMPPCYSPYQARRSYMLSDQTSSMTASSMLFAMS